MPSKKKKYNARFPAGRIKKIMQSDEEIGKVAQAVPVIISRTLELFVESLLKKTTKITNARNARTLSPSHLKQCIISENKFDFLKDLVKNIPDISSIDEGTYDEGNGSMSSSDIPTTSASSSSVDHEANHQIIRHHLQRSQSTGIGFGSPQQQQQQQCLSNVQQRVPFPDNNNPLKHKLSSTERSLSVPTKLARLNSSPATSTITSNYLTKPQETVTSSSSAAIVTPPPPAFKIEIKSPDAGNHANNNNFPIQISYCIDANTTNTTSTISSSTPPVSCPEPPVVKIDYSKINLPMTSTSNEATSSVAPIKIDYTNFNHQSAPSYSLPQSQVQELDEDYDNL